MAEPTLFDEASLALIASGGAGKDGKVYSVKPVPVYGPELVTNGDFATDSDWALTQATISNGKLLLSTSDGSYTAASQTLGVIGKTYKVSLDVADIVGIVSITIGGGTDFDITSNGTHSFEITSTTTTLEVKRKFGVTNVSATIDNVSVKEVLVADGDFTFTRGSNLSATRVNASQLIEKGRENLSLYSNTFSSWSTISGSVTGGQAGYDGSNDAWLLTKTGDWSRVEQAISQTGVWTFSVYAKAGTNNWFALENSGVVSDTCYFNLSNGTKGSVGSGTIGSSIESVGNGWYRCSVTINSTSAIQRIYVATSNGNINGSNGTIYIQDAQLEQGLAATPYIETGALTAQAGILEDTPRFDYSGGATCPSLLLEPSRTNVFARSEGYYDWSKAGATITVNQGLSPEGVNNAALFEATAPSQPRIENNVANVSSVYSTSIFVKKVVGDYFGIGWYQADVGNSFAKFNIAEGTFDGYVGNELTSADIVPYGNGWYRISVKLSTTSSTSKSGVKFVAMSSASAGAGNIGDQFLLYGAQLELGSYATSYIPTYGGGQTRAGEICGDAGDASTFNDNEGVLYAEIGSLIGDESVGQLSLSNGTANETIKILYLNSNSVRVEMQTVSGVNFVKDITLTRDGTFDKVAIRYKSNNYAVYHNGVSQTVTQTASTPIGLNKIAFNRGDGGSIFYGNVKQVLVFKEALSDTELIKLTTI